MVNNAISAVSNLANRVGSSISSAISGRRASGGSVSQGSSYLVGENGPEVFMPMAGGTIIPNGASVGGGGSIAIDMSGGVFLDRTVAVQIGDMIVRRLREIHRISST